MIIYIFCVFVIFYPSIKMNCIGYELILAQLNDNFEQIIFVYFVLSSELRIDQNKIL